MKPTGQNTSRREFLKLTAGVVTLPALTGLMGCRAPAARRETPVGVQLYSVRHELAQDMPGTFARLAEIGFQGVEFADYHGRSAEELRAMLDANGLRAAGSHVYMETLLGDQLPATVAFNRTLGNEDLIVRWIPEEGRDSLDSFLRTTERFNEIAERLEPHGMRVGYHSHAYIFETFDGKTLWNILADNTRDDVVLQLDTGYAAAMGQDIPALLRRNPGRTASMHLKPYDPSNPRAALGEDAIDWEPVIRTAEDVADIEWYIIEFEEENPLPVLETSLYNLHNIEV